MIKTTIPRRGSELLLMKHKGLRLVLPCRKPRDSACPHALNENTNQEWEGQNKACPSEQLIIICMGWYPPWFKSPCQGHLGWSQLPIQMSSICFSGIIKIICRGTLGSSRASCRTEGQEELWLGMLRQQEWNHHHSYVLCGDQNYFVILRNPIWTQSSLTSPSWATESIWSGVNRGTSASLKGWCMEQRKS